MFIKALVLKMSILLEKIMDPVDMISATTKSVDSQILYPVIKWSQLSMKDHYQLQLMAHISGTIIQEYFPTVELDLIWLLYLLE